MAISATCAITEKPWPIGPAVVLQVKECRQFPCGFPAQKSQPEKRWPYGRDILQIMVKVARKEQTGRGPRRKRGLESLRKCAFFPTTNCHWGLMQSINSSVCLHTSKRYIFLIHLLFQAKFIHRALMLCIQDTELAGGCPCFHSTCHPYK